MRTPLHAIVTAALAALLVSGTAMAADPTPKNKTSQQSRMKTCNADAKSQQLKGAERKAFMVECLKAK